MRLYAHVMPVFSIDAPAVSGVVLELWPSVWDRDACIPRMSRLVSEVWLQRYQLSSHAFSVITFLTHHVYGEDKDLDILDILEINVKIINIKHIKIHHTYTVTLQRSVYI